MQRSTVWTLASVGLMAVFVVACTPQRRSAVEASQAPTAAHDEDAARALGADLFRQHYQERIARALGTAAGVGWRAQVTILGNPDPASAVPGAAPDAWHWAEAAVSVTLIGARDAEDARIDGPTIEHFVTRVMREKMSDSDPLTVIVRQRREGEEETEAVAVDIDQQMPLIEVDEPLPSPIPDQSVYRGPVTLYTVQPGDTWADISIAFYGTPNLWRLVLSANPDMAARELQAGRQIRVPSDPDLLAPTK